MEFIKKDRPLKAINLAGLNKNELRTSNPYFDVYHVRALVCGATGSGKTTFILNYLFQYLNYYSVIIYMAPSETFESGYLKTIRSDKKLSAKFIFLDIRNEKLPTISELQKKLLSLNETYKKKEVDYNSLLEQSEKIRKNFSQNMFNNEE